MKHDTSADALWLRGGLLVVLSAACIMLANCGGLAGAATESPTGQSAVSPTLTTGAQSIRASDDQNGKSVTLHPGEMLTVVLSTTAWTFQGSSNQQVLAQVGAAVASLAPFDKNTCPFGGCGTVTAMFRAVAPGTAQVTASRSSCGEAMGCTTASGRYQLTIIVTAASH